MRALWLLLLLVPAAAAQSDGDAILRYPSQQVFVVQETGAAWNAQAVQARAGDTLEVTFHVRLLGQADLTDEALYTVTWFVDDLVLATRNGSLAPDRPREDHNLSATLPSLEDGEHVLRMRLEAPWDRNAANNDPPTTRLILGAGAAATVHATRHPWLGSVLVGAMAGMILLGRVAAVRAPVSRLWAPWGRRIDDARLAWPHRAPTQRRRLVAGVGIGLVIAGMATLYAVAGRSAWPLDPSGPFWVALTLGTVSGALSSIVRRRVAWRLALRTAAWALGASLVWQQAALVLPFVRWPDIGSLWPFIVNGLTVGGMYALIALGYTMVYGVLKFINFAHGDVFLWGGYLAWMVAVQFPIVGLPLALLWAIVATAGLGAAIERVAYRPLRGSDRLAPLITAIAVSMLLAATAQFFWGTRSHTFNEAGSTYNGSVWQAWLTRRLSWGAVDVQVLDIVIVVVALAALGGLQWIVSRTRLGQAMRAVADDRETARIVGIPVDRVITWTFVLGSGLAAIGGVFWALRFSLRPTLGLLTGIKAFTAAVVGGIGHIPGAFAGGIIIGLAENVGGQFIDSRFQHTIAFLILMVFLIVRPRGIWGKEVGRK